MDPLIDAIPVPKTKCGPNESPKDNCYKKYLEQTAYCGETYPDDYLYGICMANAWKNFIFCLNGLPPQTIGSSLGSREIRGQE